MRDAKRCAVALLILIALVVPTGCSAPSGPQVDAVRGYLAGLPAALHGDTLAGIRPYATEDQVDKVRRYVSNIVYQGSRMEATLAELRFTASEVTGAEASVETRESWTVRYVDAATGETREQESYTIEARYTLVSVEGSWTVSDVEELAREQR